MKYQAIPNVDRPVGSEATFIGRSQESISIPCVSLSSTITSKVKQNSEGALKALTTIEVPRLSKNPIKLRHNGSSVDIELSIDHYGASVWTDVQEADFPPPDPFLIPNNVEYFRSTALYCFVGVETLAASYKVWDGRSLQVVSALTGLQADPSSKLDSVRSTVRDTLLGPKSPTFIVSLEGYAKTTSLPPATQNFNELDDIIERFLLEHYNASGIPEAPLRFKDAVGFSLVVPLGSTQTIAAKLQNYEFIEWVVHNA
jgi:hypothetical protein